MAFIQANSAGSTITALYLCKVSWRCLTSAATWLGFPVVFCRCRPECGCWWGERVNAVNSGALKRGEDSRGRHHWTAFRRKSSDQASSSKITWTNRVIARDKRWQESSFLFFLFFLFLYQFEISLGFSIFFFFIYIFIVFFFYHGRTNR